MGVVSAEHRAKKFSGGKNSRRAEAEGEGVEGMGGAQRREIFLISLFLSFTSFISSFFTSLGTTCLYKLQMLHGDTNGGGKKIASLFSFTETGRT